MTLRNSRRTARASLALGFFLLVSMTPLPAFQAAGGQKAGEDELLALADAQFEKNEYGKAIEGYLEVVRLAKSKLNLSKASFGAALSHFYLRDLVNSRIWIRKVLAVDPNKEITTHFYPAGFVDLFDQTRREIREGKNKTAAPIVAQTAKGDAAAVKAPAEKPAQETPRITAQQKSEVRPSAPIVESAWNQGKWEFEVHASRWSVNPIKSLFEDDLKEEIAEEISDLITKKIGRDYPGLPTDALGEELTLDSNGSNFGFGVRFYPLGRKGVMSIGLSYEKTKMKLLAKGRIRQDYENGSYGLVDAEAFFTTSPSAIHMSFRWDLAPSWRVTPYLGLGIGVASFEGTGKYSYTGEYVAGGNSEILEGSETKTLDEVGQDMDVDIPSKMILLQASLGLKGRIIRGLFANAEAAFWNGFILRGGISYRF